MQSRPAPRSATFFWSSSAPRDTPRGLVACSQRCTSRRASKSRNINTNSYVIYNTVKRDTNDHLVVGIFIISYVELITSSRENHLPTNAACVSKARNYGGKVDLKNVCSTGIPVEHDCSTGPGELPVEQDRLYLARFSPLVQVLHTVIATNDRCLRSGTWSGTASIGLKLVFLWEWSIPCHEVSCVPLLVKQSCKLLK